MIATGQQDGFEERIRHFLETFTQELSRQVTLGQAATDPDYFHFQKTVNSNVRRNAQIRNQILLRKLLVFDPRFTDVLGLSVIAEASIEQALAETGKRIAALIQRRNEEYARDQGEDLFKPTNKTTSALSTIGMPVRDYPQYREWLDGLYFLFRESVGQRLDGIWPESFKDVNTLRTAEHHDVDHGKTSKVSAKRRRFGNVFRKLAGVTTPETLAPERFVLVQAKLLQALEGDIQNLKWK
jgi:hypothetical protein